MINNRAKNEIYYFIKTKIFANKIKNTKHHEENFYNFCFYLVFLCIHTNAQTAVEGNKFLEQLVHWG